MKRLSTTLAVFLLGSALFAGNFNSDFNFGFQACSDSTFGIFVKGWHLESAVKVQLQLFDPGDEFFLVGAHVAWLFNSKSGTSSFGIGPDFRVGLGSGISEYVDLYARLNYNYHLSEHLMITGIFYPFALSTRETEGADDWNSTVTIPSAAVALAVLF